MIYQVTFVVQNEADQEAVKKAVSAVGGVVVDERLIGERKFTYPIKKLTQGIYFTYHIDIDPQAIAELDQKLRLQEKVIRSLIVRTQTIVKPVQVVPVKEAAPALPTVRPIQPTVVAKPVKPVAKPTQPITKPTKAKAVTQPAVSEAERLKKLEEKLKELLQE